MVLSLRGKEESRFNYVGWVISHHTVRDIEALDILNCRSLDMSEQECVYLSQCLYLHISRHFEVIAGLESLQAEKSDKFQLFFWRQAVHFSIGPKTSCSTARAILLHFT